jgi:hypothetical protein
MRHHVPDAKTQQQQQASFLASIQHHTTIVKDLQKSVIPSTTVIKQEEDFGFIDQSIITKGQNQSSINNCIISMNSNGQYQIKQSHPRIIVKDQVKTMSPLIFSPNQPVVTTISSVNNSSIQSEWYFTQSILPKTNSAQTF